MPRKPKTLQVKHDYPLPPENLPEDAQGLWHRVCGHLHSAGYQLDVAEAQVHEYCVQSLVYKANAAVVIKSKTPGVEKFTSGNRGVCKNYAAMNDARKRMEKFESNWGFNPYAASKITAPDKADVPDFDL